MKTSERSIVVIKTQQTTRCPSTRQFNQYESNKAQPVIQVSEVDGNKGNDQLPHYEVEKGHGMEGSLRGGSISDVQHPVEADYEDASDGDNVSVNSINSSF